MASILIDTDDSALEKHVDHIVQIVLKNHAIKPAVEKLDTTFFHKSLHTPIHLTNQQARCLKFLAQGQSAKEIAREMTISYRTVEGNLAKTMELLGCTSSKELVALYYEQP
jgi:shikimate kinase